jgi:hypothetical protein
MTAKKQIRKERPKRKVKPVRTAKRQAQKLWHPTNYLLESNIKLGLPDYEEETRVCASPV